MTVTVHNFFSTDKPNTRLILALFLVFAIFALMPDFAHAQTTTGALPWVSFSCKLAEMLTGDWVKWMAVIAVALGGLMFGLGELNGPFKLTLQIAGGFSIALGAAGVVGLLLPGSMASC